MSAAMVFRLNMRVAENSITIYVEWAHSRYILAIYQHKRLLPNVLQQLSSHRNIVDQTLHRWTLDAIDLAQLA